jgi:hypothetical protein
VTDFVLDNSVTMRWCFDGGSHDYADKVLQPWSRRVARRSAARVLTDVYRLATLHRLTVLSYLFV